MIDQVRTHLKIRPTGVIAVILAIAALYFYQDPGWNGNSRLDAVRAVVEQGTFQIDAYHNQPGWATMDKSIYAGHFYTDKSIGSSLLAIPAYFVLYRLSMGVGIVLSSAFIKHLLTAVVMGGAFVVNGILLYLIACQLTENRWKGALAALAVSLGTMLWPYTAVYYGHVPAAMFLALAFYLLLGSRNVPEANLKWHYFGAALAMGFAFITEYPTALVILGLIAYGVYLLWRRRVRSVVPWGVAGMAGALLPLSAMLLYNYAVYGSVLMFGYSHVAVGAFQQGLEQGFMGIGVPNLMALYHFTFDPRFGIFWQSPVLVLSVVGFAIGFRKRATRAETIAAAYAIAAIFLMNAGYFMWWGGSAFGARYVIIALPFFIVPLALLPDNLSWLLGALAAVSAAQMLIPLSGNIQIGIDYARANDPTISGRKFRGLSILYEYGLPLALKMARKGNAPWMLGSLVGLGSGPSLAMLAGVEAALLRFLFKTTRESSALHEVEP